MTRQRVGLVLGVVGLSYLSSAKGLAQQPPAAQEPPTAPQPAVVQPTPTFPRGVELVTVDVVVSDKAGNPVSGLTRDDFTVMDEGQPRPIATFDSIRLTASPAAAGVGPAPPRPRLATNREAGPSGGRS